MSVRDPDFDAYVLKIHAVLDRLDYYRLLGLDQSAKVPDVKRAFYSIAARFHPDRNRNASPEVRQAIYDIFKRLNEAYRVLCDYERRKSYDKGLSDGTVRLIHEARRTSAPRMPEDSIKSREARQFYRQAKEAMSAGNLMQADLHIKVAKNREGQNEVIEALENEIREALVKRKKK